MVEPMRSVIAISWLSEPSVQVQLKPKLSFDNILLCFNSTSILHIANFTLHIIAATWLNLCEYQATKALFV